MTDTRRARRIIGTWVAVAAIVLFATLGTVTLGPHIQSALKSATTPNPEHFTELYFDQHLDLPKEVDADTTYTVPFVLVNHEGVPTDYRYQVTVSQNGEIINQSQHTTHLKNAERQTNNLTFTPNATGESLLVTVTLLHNNQSIHFRAQS